MPAAIKSALPKLSSLHGDGCQGSQVSTRLSLLLCSLAAAVQPVVIVCFGPVILSYNESVVNKKNIVIYMAKIKSLVAARETGINI